MPPLRSWGVNVPSGESLIALAKAFGVSRDYLAQMEPLNSTQVAIADLDLVDKVQLGDKLGDNGRPQSRRSGSPMPL